MSASRAVPVEPDAAFRWTIGVPLPTIFHRWFGPIAPIAEVRGQDGPWGSVGQTRTVVQAAGAGTFEEELVVVEPGRRFAYRLTDPGGPVRALIGSVEGEWVFEPAGTGTRITWTWRVEPANAVASALMPAFARAWKGFARQGLEELEGFLLAAR